MSGTGQGQSLYEIESELARLDELLEAAGGDTGAASEAAGQDVQAWLQKYEWAERGKIDNYGHFWASLSACAAGIREEEKRLASRRQAMESKIDSLKKLAGWAMDRRKVEKLEGMAFTISRQKNGGKAPLVMKEPYASEPHKLPEPLQRVTVAPDSGAIRETLEKDPDTVFLLTTKQKVKITDVAEIGVIGTSIRLR